jgi:hypothetical protein
LESKLRVGAKIRMNLVDALKSEKKLVDVTGIEPVTPLSK